MAIEPKNNNNNITNKLDPPKMGYWAKFYHKPTHETFCKASSPQWKAQFRFCWLCLCIAWGVKKKDWNNSEFYHCSLLFLVDFVNWIRLQEERPHRKTILHLISTYKSVSPSLVIMHTHLRQRKWLFKFPCSHHPARNAMLIRLESQVRVTAASSCLELTVTFEYQFMPNYEPKILLPL